jgi:hypothetical protein
MKTFQEHRIIHCIALHLSLDRDVAVTGKRQLRNTALDCLTGCHGFYDGNVLSLEVLGEDGTASPTYISSCALLLHTS